MPSTGSGISGGTSSAGNATSHVPSGSPYRHKLSLSGSHSEKNSSTSRPRASRTAERRPEKSLKMSSTERGFCAALGETEAMSSINSKSQLYSKRESIFSLSVSLSLSLSLSRGGI
nr:hypothetical protein Iba_chr02bCG23160 [Ipomoea batatas]